MYIPLVHLPETTVGMTSGLTNVFGSLTLTTDVSSAAAAATTAAATSGAAFGIGRKPKVSDDCPPDGASTRDVVRL